MTDNEDSTHEYDEDAIEEFRALGLSKPPEVSWGDWTKNQTLTHRHELLAHLAATGATNKSIASELDMSEVRVSVLLSNTAIKTRIKEIQTQYWGDSIEKKLNSLLPESVNVAEEILKDETEKSSLRADIAFRLMDRILGKPVQKTEIKGSLISDLLVQLDQLDKEQGTAEKDVKPLDIEQDKLDTFVDGFVTEEITVGKKSTAEKEEDDKDDHRE